MVASNSCETHLRTHWGISDYFHHMYIADKIRTTKFCRHDDRGILWRLWNHIRHIATACPIANSRFCCHVGSSSRKVLLVNLHHWTIRATTTTPQSWRHLQSLASSDYLSVRLLHAERNPIPSSRDLHQFLTWKYKNAKDAQNAKGQESFPRAPRAQGGWAAVIPPGGLQ